MSFEEKYIITSVFEFFCWLHVLNLLVINQRCYRVAIKDCKKKNSNFVKRRLYTHSDIERIPSEHKPRRTTKVSKALDIRLCMHTERRLFQGCIWKMTYSRVQVQLSLAVAYIADACCTRLYRKQLAHEVTFSSGDMWKILKSPASVEQIYNTSRRQIKLLALVDMWLRRMMKKTSSDVDSVARVTACKKCEQ